jgi:hypothetical protein
MSSASDDSSGDSSDARILDIAVQQQQRVQRVVQAANMFGMYYSEKYLNKSARREVKLTGHEWVTETLNRPRQCYRMFRMTRTVLTVCMKHWLTTMA